MRRLKLDDATLAAQQDTLNQTVTQRLLEGEHSIDRWLIKWSDVLSPIVVKETRQALRSRQFVWTFGFLLLCILGWTFLNIISRYPGIYYFPAGGPLLLGYVVMLAVPALIIIPLAAFFSMAGELNSNTFEVLSISPLSSHKIVLGKVIVAGVQLLLYFSALAPCIALTYLLRGISLTSLLMIFPIMVVASFLVISVSVMLATFCRTVFHNILFMLVQLVICGIAISITVGIVGELATSNYMLLSTWSDALAFVSVLALLASYGVLAILVGGASIGITGENYSRRIRIWLALQGAALFIVCLMEMPNEYSYQRDSVMVTTTLLMLHWAISGVFIVAESGVLSIRAQRSLADTFSGKILGVWLNPGGGTGYLFVVLNFAAYTSTFIMLMLFTNESTDSMQFVMAALSYLILYLGILRLIMMYVPRGGAGSAALPVLLGALLLSIGSGAPMFLSMYASNFRTFRYEPYCFTNPIWTLGDFQPVLMMQSPLLLLYLSAIGVFLMNAIMVSGDITLVRVKSPDEIDLDLKQRKSQAKTLDPFAVD